MMFVCSRCQYASTTKIGKCPDCGAFGTFIEDIKRSVSNKEKKRMYVGKVLQKQSFQKKYRNYPICDRELRRVFPGGLVAGGLYLLGGSPGIGKSTMMLHILSALQCGYTKEQKRALSLAYFSGEETPDQIYQRIARVCEAGDQDHIHVYHSACIEDSLRTAEHEGYDVLVFDSIQTMYSNRVDAIAGSVSQVRFCSEAIAQWCKKNNTTCFLVSHVTKGGIIAGPKYLEHIVDVVLYLEGDKYGQYRFLKYSKNRFGSSDDMGIFEMSSCGLHAVYDLQKRILNEQRNKEIGSVMSVGIEHGRAVLIQVEALINRSYGKFPQRLAQGVDVKRLQLIVAILDRYLKLGLGSFDIYINIPGEFSFRDNGLDLAIACALYSQVRSKQIPQNQVFFAELGLGGQILASSFHEKRKKEAGMFDICDNSTIQHIRSLPDLLQG